MSLSFLTTTTTTTTTPISSFCTPYSRNHFNHLSITNNNKSSSCVQKQKLPNLSILHRRHVLVGLGVLTGFASGLCSPTLTASAAPEDNGSLTSQIQSVPEFGSNPRPLDSTIRVLVPRSKPSQNEADKGELVEVIRVEGVEVPNNGPVRFDVYVAKPDGDRVGSDLGVFVGNLADLACLRVGRKFRKLGLTLGISGLVEEIGAEESEKLVVSLVPRLGEMIIGGIRLGYIPADG